MHALERHVLHTLRHRALVRPGERGLVLVSGGPDSLALLLVLHTLAPALAVSLEAVHFDHGLRPESGAEADWVAARVRPLGLPLHLRRAGHLAGLRAGVQAAARDWRREEAERLRTERGAAWIATGHQRDDDVETWLLKWLRGAHLSHLQGMDWRAGEWIRPLLDCPRRELTDYLTDRGERWLEDPSNCQPRYKRSRVRHELRPLLEELSGGALDRRLEALAEQSRELGALLDAVLAEAAPAQNDPARPPHWLDAEAAAALPASARKEALSRFVQARLPGAVPYAVLADASRLLGAGSPYWALHLPAGRVLRRAGERLLLERHGGSDRAGSVAVHVGGYAVHVPSGWRVAAGDDTDVPDAPVLVLHNLPAGAALRVRAATPGDRFHPPGRERPLRLREYLRAHGVPLWQRDRVPVVVWNDAVIAVWPAHIAHGHTEPRDEGVEPLRLCIQNDTRTEAAGAQPVPT